MHHDALPSKPASWSGADCPVDMTVLGLLAEVDPDDPSFVAELVTTFLEDSEQRVQRLQVALESSDWKAIELEAHTLKSSSANLGVRLLSEACEKAESLARQGTTSSELCAALEDIRSHHAGSVRFFDRYLSETR